MANNNYPYSRSDECCWQPEEAARRLGALVSLISHPVSSTSSSLPIASSSLRVDGYDPLSRNDDDNATASHALSTNRTNLLTRGRNSIDVRALRRAFGSNSLHGDDVEDEQKQQQRRMPVFGLMKQRLHFFIPILHAFYDQLKEPLILMLLFSAAISLFLGNAADAISIALALSIVSLVAAIQEYRSEQVCQQLVTFSFTLLLQFGHVDLIIKLDVGFLLAITSGGVQPLGLIWA